MSKFKNYIKSNKIMVIYLILLVLCFSILSVMVLNNKFNNIDLAVHTFVLGIRNDSLTVFFKTVTEFGGATFLIALCALLVVLVKKKSVPLFLSFNLLISFLTNETAKSIFMRDRPIGIALFEETGYSFPSGHSMVSLSFYGFVIYLILKSKFNKFTKIFLTTLLSLLVLIIGFSRIYLGVHYLTDIIGGFILSLIYLTIFINVMKERM